jgi:hypothetical protein
MASRVPLGCAAKIQWENEWMMIMVQVFDAQ